MVRGGGALHLRLIGARYPCERTPQGRHQCEDAPSRSSPRQLQSRSAPSARPAAFGGADGEGQPPASSAETKAATDAALRATGGGTANAVERDGENGAVWEVEVTKPDGQTVDVRLAADLSVVVIEGDHEGPENGADDGG